MSTKFKPDHSLKHYSSLFEYLFNSYKFGHFNLYDYASFMSFIINRFNNEFYSAPLDRKERY